VADTWIVPVAAAPTVSKPLASMVPVPEATRQVTFSGGLAVNCCVAPGANVTEGGLIVSFDTVTVTLTTSAPRVARTEKEPAVGPAVKIPAGVMVPPPLGSDQVTPSAGSEVNCIVPPVDTVGLTGLMANATIVTVAVAEPVFEVAVICNGPRMLPAVNTPVLKPIVPILGGLTLHTMLVLGVAVKVYDFPGVMFNVVGVMVTPPLWLRVTVAVAVCILFRVAWMVMLVTFILLGAV